MYERQSLVTGRLTVSYLAAGPKDAQPVVLVHGASRDAFNWTRVMDELSQRRRVYAMEMRGHGKTSWMDSYFFDDLADDLVGFVTTLGLSNVTLVGHSYGGAAVSVAAMRQPDWLANLVLEEPSTVRPGMPKATIQPDTETEFNFDYGSVIRDMIAMINEPNPQWWKGFRSITVPTLLYVGATVPNQNQARMRDAAELIPDCLVETIPVGHDVHLDAHDDFMRAFDTFLQRCARSGLASAGD